MKLERIIQKAGAMAYEDTGKLLVSAHCYNMQPFLEPSRWQSGMHTASRASSEHHTFLCQEYLGPESH